ncbi:DNA polymerase III subunit epsilon [Halomonas sp. WWR20]
MRQIVLDTETTGIDPKQGHRLVEIGAVELINRRFTGNTYHQYINPQRAIDPEAIAVHGITDERVASEPVFADVADAFWEFIKGAELVIHNAAFDVGFIDHEFGMLNASRSASKLGPVSDHCGILDTLKLARDRHPGQRNNLDALCKRYAIDNGHRVLHGALLDAEILADVYLTMTGGQTALLLGGSDESRNGDSQGASGIRRIDRKGMRLAVTPPTHAELQAHRAKLDQIRQAAGSCHWDALEGSAEGTGQDATPEPA